MRLGGIPDSPKQPMVHNDFMRQISSGAYLITQVLLMNALAAPVLAAAEPDAKKRAWEVYERARERAGAEPSAQPVRDYTFDLVTRTNNPKEKDKQIELTSKGFFLTPNLVRQEIQAPNAKIIVVFDGEKGWQMLPNDVRYLSDGASAQIKADLARSHVLLAEPPAPDQVRFLREEEVDGRMTEVIELNDVGNMPLRLFVEKKTGDVIKKMFVGDTPTGLAQVEELYSDFRVVGGYRWPFVKRVLRNGKFALESTTLGMKVNLGLTKNDMIR